MKPLDVVQAKAKTSQTEDKLISVICENLNATGVHYGRNVHKRPQSNFTNLKKIGMMAGATFLLMASAFYTYQGIIHQYSENLSDRSIKQFKQFCSGEYVDKIVDNITYKGCMANGKFEGFGKAIYPNNDTYTGDFHLGIPHGHGNLTHPNGNFYVGGMKDGKMNGTGILKGKPFEYEGSFTDGIFDGPGKLTLAGGAIYQGDWQKGLLQRDWQKGLLQQDGSLKKMGLIITPIMGLAFLVIVFCSD